MRAGCQGLPSSHVETSPAPRCGFLIVTLARDARAQQAAANVLFYTHPAREWNQALPLGNGRLGAMVFGNVDRERIQLNENSLWMGGPRETNNPEALKHLAEVRRLLFAGMPVEAYAVAEKYSMGQPFQARVVPVPRGSASDVRARRHADRLPVRARHRQRRSRG